MASQADILRKLLAAKAEREAEKSIEDQQANKFAPLHAKDVSEAGKTGSIELNEQQLQAVEFARTGQEFCLIGAAGSGKTTASINVVQACCDKLGIKPEDCTDGTIAILAFTRRAARNSAKSLVKINGEKLCMTAHKCLEYAPEEYWYFDENGDEKKGFRFAPMKTADNPILNARLIIIEEASMLGLGLHQQLKDACPNATFIYIGDLNQLPPVFGDAILGYKLASAPVVELTKIYRQAMDSPIIAFQHQYTLRGIAPSEKVMQDFSAKATDESGLKFSPMKKQAKSIDTYNGAVANYMIRQYEAGVYAPEQDTILVPYNKKFGSIGINLEIANYLGKKREAEIWEIICGFENKYFAVGDFIMYEKAECVIKDIIPNPKYFGKDPKKPSKIMDRHGWIEGSAKVSLDRKSEDDFTPMDFDALMNKNFSTEEEDRKTAASAVITLEDLDTGNVFSISTASEIGGTDFGYCMTIHKSQGSEWRKVWLVACRQHASMLSRELLYTGMTRAKDRLEVIYSPETAPLKRNSSIEIAIKRQRVPGKTWQEKAEYFKGKQNGTN